MLEKRTKQAKYTLEKRTKMVKKVLKKRTKRKKSVVKSGKNYTKHAALGNVLENKRYGIKEAFVFYNGNVEMKGKVAYYPVYMLMFLEKESMPEEMIYRIDLTGLQ